MWRREGSGRCLGRPISRGRGPQTGRHQTGRARLDILVHTGPPHRTSGHGWRLAGRGANGPLALALHSPAGASLGRGQRSGPAPPKRACSLTAFGGSQRTVPSAGAAAPHRRTAKAEGPGAHGPWACTTGVDGAAFGCCRVDGEGRLEVSGIGSVVRSGGPGERSLTEGAHGSCPVPQGPLLFLILN